MKNPRSLPGPARGFTLIELIIALALVALITVLLFSGLRLGGRAWDGVDAVAERNAEVRSARGFLDRALMQARDLTINYDAEDRQIFAGNATQLEFAAPLSEHVGVPGLYVLRLGLEGRGERSRLVLTRWLLHSDVLAGKGDTPEWQPLDPDSPGVSGDSAEDRDLAAGAYGQTVLLEGVADFELAYFGVAQEVDLGASGEAPEAEARSPTRATARKAAKPAGLDGEEPEGEWYDEWIDQPHPPQLVRVRLTSRRQDWPDSVIALPQVDQPQAGAIQVGVPQPLPDAAEPGAVPPVPPRGTGAKAPTGPGSARGIAK